MSPDFDVIVIGAGPSGCSAAAELSARGFDVLLVEKSKFPRRKVCGDGLTPRALAFLREIGAEGFLKRKGFRFNWYIFHLGKEKPLKLSAFSNKIYPDYGYTVIREELDEFLLEWALSSGASHVQGTFVKPVSDKEGFVKGAVLDIEGRETIVSGKLLIGADGAHSKVARYLGMHDVRSDWKGVALSAHCKGVSGTEDALEILVMPEIAPIAGWVFPLNDNMANIGIALFNFLKSAREADLKKCWDKLFSKGGLLGNRMSEAELTDRPAGGLLQSDMERVRQARNGAMLVGDAAGLVNPGTGEGVSYALESGKIAAQTAASNWPDVSEESLSKYRSMLLHLYESPYSNTRKHLPFIYRKSVMKAAAPFMKGHSITGDLLKRAVYIKGSHAKTGFARTFNW